MFFNFYMPKHQISKNSLESPEIFHYLSKRCAIKRIMSCLVGK